MTTADLPFQAIQDYMLSTKPRMMKQHFLLMYKTSIPNSMFVCSDSHAFSVEFSFSRYEFVPELSPIMNPSTLRGHELNEDSVPAKVMTECIDFTISLHLKLSSWAASVTSQQSMPILFIDNGEAMATPAQSASPPHQNLTFRLHRDFLEVVSCSSKQDSNHDESLFEGVLSTAPFPVGEETDLFFALVISSSRHVDQLYSHSIGSNRSFDVVSTSTKTSNSLLGVSRIFVPAVDDPTQLDLRHSLSIVSCSYLRIQRM